MTRAGGLAAEDVDLFGSDIECAIASRTRMVAESAVLTWRVWLLGFRR